METRAKMRSRGTVTITPYALSSFSISGGLFKDPGFGKESQTAKTAKTLKKEYLAVLSSRSLYNKSVTSCYFEKILLMKQKFPFPTAGFRGRLGISKRPYPALISDATLRALYWVLVC